MAFRMANRTRHATVIEDKTIQPAKSFMSNIQNTAGPNGSPV